MTTPFSPSEAAFSFIPFAKAHGRFVAKFAGFFGLASIIQAAVLQPSGFGRAMNELQTSMSSETAPQDFQRAFESVNMAALVPAFLVAVALNTVLLAMALRKTVRNEELAGIGLTWGRDETALLIANLLLGLLMTASFLLLGVILGAASALVPAVGALLAPVGVVLLLVLTVGRLGLWGVVTIANGRSSLRHAWQISRESFWGFVGAFLLCFIVALIASWILGAILAIIAGALGSPTGSGIPGNLAQTFSPGWLVFLFGTGAMSGITTLALICVGSYAWHEMGRGRTLDMVA